MVRILLLRAILFLLVYNLRYFQVHDFKDMSARSTVSDMDTIFSCLFSAQFSVSVAEYNRHIANNIINNIPDLAAQDSAVVCSTAVYNIFPPMNRDMCGRVVFLLSCIKPARG